MADNGWGWAAVRARPVEDMPGWAFFLYVAAVALGFGLIGFALGFKSAYVTARIASYQMPADCTYLRGGVVICLFPNANRKGGLERGP